MATDFTEETAADAVVDSFAKTPDPRLRELLSALHPADVADLMGFLSAGDREELIPHLDPETLARLEAAGARVYRTDRDGAVIVETDGIRLWVTRWASVVMRRSGASARSATR